MLKAGQPCLITSLYVSSLSKYIKDCGKIGPLQARSLAFQIFEGLEKLRDSRIVVADLNPMNILLSEDLSDIKIVLANLGFSQRIDCGAFPKNSVITTCLDRQYLAPEVMEHGFGGLGYDSDLWAAACCVFEMVTGRPPFVDFPELTPESIEQELASLQYSPILEIVGKCFHYDPGSRPSATEVKECLKTLRTKWLSKRLLFFYAIEGGFPALNEDLPIQLRSYCDADIVLGSGTFGIVIRVKAKSGRGSTPTSYFAVKVFYAPGPIGTTFSELQERMLFKEARNMMLIQNAHVVNIIEFGISDLKDAFWIKMEYVNQSLSTILTEKKMLAESTCTQMARHTLSGLKAIHDLCMLHRDIKPSNIAYHEDGDIWILLDLGLSSEHVEGVQMDNSFLSSASTKRERFASFVGTLPYMSPEMFRNRRMVSAASDIWSLGVTLFVACTGCHPFEKPDDMDWSLSIAGDMETEATSVKVIVPQLSGFFANIISIALKKKIKERWQTAQEMIQAFDSYPKLEM